MTETFDSRTLTVRIGRAQPEVYDFVATPENVPRWATGLGRSLTKVNDEWIVEAPEGRVRVRFTERNAFGVADHHVVVPPGREVYVPIRVVANGTGSEVIVTVFRLPGTDEQAFARDISWVERDLRALKALLEG
jgi:hypothetical protein